MNMTHVALARKYRPTSFCELVAQEHVAAGLAGAVAKERVAHAYLLTGQRGVGKTSAARILAMALNCENRGGAPSAGEPCGKCESCARIWSGSTSIDVVEIDAASNRGVDDARDLRERAMYAASRPDRYKVYIVDEAHMLTREAWNALLKILEEPPSRVVFVFATTEPQKIAATAAPVLSRVQRFDFRRIGPQRIVERLRYVAGRESIEIEQDALHLIARVADGAMRDGLSLLDQALAFGDGPVTAARVREALGLIDDEMYAELLALISERRAADVFPYVARLADAGADLAEFINGAGETLRAMLIQMMGGQPEGLTESLRAAVARYGSKYKPGDVLRMLKLLAAAENAIRRSPNARLHVETLLLQWSLLDRTVELSDVLQAVGERHQAPAVSRPSGRGARVLAARARASEGSETGKPAAGESDGGILTLEAIRARWPDILEAVGRRRRMVREALLHAVPASVNGDAVVLEVIESEVHMEGLEKSRSVVTESITEVMGARVARVVYTPVGSGGEASSVPPVSRLNRDADHEERLRYCRQADPGLNAIAEALDLEVIE